MTEFWQNEEGEFDKALDEGACPFCGKDSCDNAGHLELSKTMSGPVVFKIEETIPSQPLILVQRGEDSKLLQSHGYQSTHKITQENFRFLPLGVRRVWAFRSPGDKGKEFLLASREALRFANVEISPLECGFKTVEDMQASFGESGGEFREDLDRRIESAPRGKGRHWDIGSQLDERFPPIRWLVERMLQEGLGLFFGDPKAGKSRMATSLALSVASGTPFLANFQARRSGVLYIDLEDSPSLAEERWRTCLGGLPRPSNLQIRYDWARVGSGFLRKVKRHCEQYPDCGLIIVDTWAKITPEEISKSLAAANAYIRDNRLLEPLHEFALDRHISILLVHHTNAEGRQSGSQGMLSVPGAIWKLTRDKERVPGEEVNSGRLAVSGRSGVLQRSWALEFDELTGLWSVANSSMNPAQERAERQYLEFN